MSCDRYLEVGMRPPKSRRALLRIILQLLFGSNHAGISAVLRLSWGSDDWVVKAVVYEAHMIPLGASCDDTLPRISRLLCSSCLK